MTAEAASVSTVTADVYRFPTPKPEADGTLVWDATTVVAAHVSAAGMTGLGWTYSAAAAAEVVTGELAKAVSGQNALDVEGAWQKMHRQTRNFGTKGLVMQAISAVDVALWDLKAQLLNASLIELFGPVRTSIPIYGSGGFTNLDDDELAAEVSGWLAAGCTAMKIKVAEGWGSDEARDLDRVRQLGQLAGDGVQLMVDANGGYTVGQACRVGHALDDLGVVWFEEPVSSDDLAGLDAVRSAVDCDVAAGEYVADSYDAARLAPVVDCLQLDVTRCGGFTGWRRAAAIAASQNLQVSGHCAPALHSVVAGSVPNVRHVEYFIDHARLEPLLFAGTPDVRCGALHPITSRHGHGMTIGPNASGFAAH